MIQNNIDIPFNLNIARKIQEHELPGSILTLAGYQARIIDFTFTAKTMLVMCMDFKGVERSRVFLKSGEAEDCTADRLILQLPEWATLKNGDVVYCEWLSCKASSQWLAILDGEIQYLSNGQPMFWHYADVMINNTNEATNLNVRRRTSSTPMVINKADVAQRRLMAEYHIKEGSAGALKLLHKFLPEFVCLLPVNAMQSAGQTTAKSSDNEKE